MDLMNRAFNNTNWCMSHGPERTLAGARKLPVELQIPVEQLAYDKLQVYTSRAALHTLLLRVRTLILNKFEQCWGRRPGTPAYNTYHLEALDMPSLRHLVLDVGPDFLRRGWYSPDTLTLPSLTHLTLQSSCIRSVEALGNMNGYPTAYHLIVALRATLKHLTLVNLVEGPWETFLTLCQRQGLDRLDLQLENGFFDANYGDAIIDVPSKELLHSAAVEVELSQEYRTMCEWF